MSANQREAQRRSAERRRCPSCNRKSAVVTIYYSGLGYARGCRWCDWEEWREHEEDRLGYARGCRWCDWEEWRDSEEDREEEDR